MSQKWHPSKRNYHLRPQRGQLRTVGADVPRNRKLNLPMSPTRITASHRITKKRTKPSQNLRVKHLSLKRPCKQKRRREPCNYRQVHVMYGMHTSHNHSTHNIYNICCIIIITLVCVLLYNIVTCFKVYYNKIYPLNYLYNIYCYYINYSAWLSHGLSP